MAQNITKIDDYVGDVRLPSSVNEGDFSEYAFEIEKRILRGNGVDDFGLLGDHVYIAMLADLDSNNEPQTAPYINLIDGVNYTGSAGTNIVFCGIRKMLTYFVYSEFIKDNKNSNVQSGTVVPAYENSENAEIKNINHKAHLRWNHGVSLYNGEVYDYILFYQSDFSNWDFTRQENYIIHGLK